jgi:type IV pilus assembly protein PilA
MLTRIRQSARTDDDKGFTLIELLVVMIIIGILAAIALPVFLNQRQKAQDAATKADVSTLGKEIATYFVDNSAAPAAANQVAISGGNYTFNGGTVGRVSEASITVVNQGFNATTPTTDWCIALINSAGSGTKVWKYTGRGGLQSGAAAGCVSGTDY